MKKPKKAREETKGAPAGTKEARKKPKKRIRPTREEKEKWILDLLATRSYLAFTELWQIANDKKDSPFRGGSESTLRRVVKGLAKQGTVNLSRTKMGAILIELPSVTAANAGCDENPAGETTGAASADGLDPFGKYLVDKAVEEAIKPPERLKTQAEIDAELLPMQERVAALHRELEKLEREINDIECAWADRHLILTTKPLPEDAPLSNALAKLVK